MAYGSCKIRETLGRGDLERSSPLCPARFSPLSRTQPRPTSFKKAS